MQHHVNSVAEVADTGGEDLGVVEILDGTEADGPAYGVDEDGCNGRVGRGLVAPVGPDGHVDRHVDVGDALEKESGEHAEPSAEDVDKTPGEDHGEDELDDPVGSASNEGRVVAVNAGVPEDLRYVVCDTVSTRPLSYSLHGHWCG